MSNNPTSRDVTMEEGTVADKIEAMQGKACMQWHIVQCIKFNAVQTLLQVPWSKQSSVHHDAELTW
jgi:hypothetical protein